MSSSGSQFVIPPGQSPPFAIVTDQDHTAWILLAAWIGLATSLVFGAIRVFVRMTINPSFGLDDLTIGCSTILGVIQSGVILGACGKGLGKSIELVSTSSQIEVEKLVYASTILFYLSVALSKGSVVFFLLRISPSQHRVIFLSAAAFLGAWMVAAVFAVALQCNLSHPWLSINQNCSGTSARLQALNAIDIVTEIGLVALSLHLVWSLQTSWSTKSGVVVAFAFRLLMIIAISFRISTFDASGFTTNPLLLEIPYLCWTQTEMNYSLISATIPALRPLVKNLNTQFGGLGPEESQYGQGSQVDSKTNKSTNRVTSRLASFGRSQQRSQQRSQNSFNDVEDNIEMVPASHAITSPERLHAHTPGTNIVTTGTDAKANSTDATSITSNESRQMMIKKEMVWEVRHETR